MTWSLLNLDFTEGLTGLKPFDSSAAMHAAMERCLCDTGAPTMAAHRGTTMMRYLLTNPSQILCSLPKFTPVYSAQPSAKILSSKCLSRHNNSACYSAWRSFKINSLLVSGSKRHAYSRALSVAMAWFCTTGRACQPAAAASPSRQRRCFLLPPRQRPHVPPRPSNHQPGTSVGFPCSSQASARQHHQAISLRHTKRGQ